MTTQPCASCVYRGALRTTQGPLPFCLSPRLTRTVQQPQGFSSVRIVPMGTKLSRLNPDGCGPDGQWHRAATPAEISNAHR